VTAIAARKTRPEVIRMSLPHSKPPRRLLYVVTEDYAFLLNRLPMARAAREAGFEVHVATRVDKGAAAIEAEGFVLHRIPFRRGGLSPFSALPTIVALRRLKRRIRPDIVHHTGLQCCVYGSVAALGETTPIVNAITGLGYIFTSLTLRTRLLKRTMSLLLPWLLNSAESLVLVQNPDDRADLERLGIKPERIVLIPGSGVDTDRLQPLPEPDGPITIGFAGRLLADKGIRALVAAHSILRGQGHDIRLIIAGNPDPANPASIPRREAEEWSRRPGVTWLGHIDNIVGLWRQCHLAALPSHREGLPMSLLEAAACGRAMISADAPGCREIVIDQQTGLLVPIESPQRLAAAIRTLAESDALRARYGQAARQFVVEKRSAKIVGKAIVELYERLCHSAPAGQKVFLVSQHYAPYPSTTSGYMTDIARALAARHQVVVLSGSPGSSSQHPAKPGEPEVVEIRSWWPQKSALFSRSLAAVLFAVQAFFAILKHARPGDAVICVTTPFTLPYAVALAARLRKVLAALIIYDFYPDTLIMAGFLQPDSFLVRSSRRANGLMFEWMDAIITIGRDMNSLLLSYPRMTSNKINLIPNWATLAVGYREIDPENPFRKQCRADFLVAMSGNAGFTHDPISVFEAARLLTTDSHIHFLLSGEGVGWKKLNEMQAASPLPNVTLIERVPEAELESFLSSADAWIIPYRKKNTGVSVPSRIYNLLAVGRPVIMCSEQDAEAAMLVQDNELGWVVPPEQPALIAEAVRTAATQPSETRSKGRHASEVALQFTPEIALQAYEVVIDRLLARAEGVSQTRIATSLPTGRERPQFDKEVP
jgi:glycosyltransferase involved in cell wall biosynthesis